MMITKKITSVVFIIAIASMFISSSVFVNSILAKTSTSSSSKGNTITSSNSKGNPATAQQDYTNFQKCLSTAAGTKGFATQLEIKNCYIQVYHILTTTGTSTTGTKIGK